jgi:uncharacterized protein (TIGR02001 family)
MIKPMQEGTLINLLKAVCRCIVSALLLPAMSNAMELPLAMGGGMGGSITWSSDYVLRGVSQSDNLPVIQADFHIRPATDWTLGAWASMVHVLPYTRSTEVNLYLSHSWNLDQDWRVNVAATHYQYINDPRAVSYTYDEVAASLQWADTLYGHLAWSPNTDLYRAPYHVHRDQQTLTIEGGWHRALWYDINFQAGAGIYWPLQQSIGRYVYGSAGLSRRFGPIHVELNYFWVQNQQHRVFNAGPAGGPWAVTASWNF